MTQVSATGADLLDGSTVRGARQCAPVRTCRETTKAGKPCRAAPLKDRDVCAMHGKAVDPTELGRLGGLASAEVRREQGRSVRDRLREKVEANADTIWTAFHDGLTSDDERLRVGAAQAVLAEAYGRPPQAIVGDVDQPVSFVVRSAFSQPSDDDGGL